MGEEKNQEDFSSASAHPQKLAPSILFLACQHLPVQNPMLPSTSFDTEASKHLSLVVAALSAFSSCLLPPRWEWERWECCSFRDAPSPGSSPVWLVPLPPRAELVSTTEHWLLHCPDKRDPAALFTLLAFQYFQFIPFALTNLKNISFSLFSFFLTHNGFENKIIRSMNPTPI